MVVGQSVMVLTMLRCTSFFGNSLLFITYAVNAGSVALSGAPFADLFSSNGVSDPSQFAAIKGLARRLPHCDLLPRSVVNYSFYFQEDLCYSASQNGSCLNILRRIFGVKFQPEWREIYD
jgi:hypothetical protein